MSRNLRRLIPSPAMIVALLALVMSLGGSAYATLMNGDSSPPYVTGHDIVDHTVRGKDILRHSMRGRKFQKDSVGGRAIKESALERFWAVVDVDLVDVRGEGLAQGDAVGKVSTQEGGQYYVIFNRDVSSCSYQATIGSTGTSLPNQGSQITVSALAAGTAGVSIPNNASYLNGVHVRTADDMNNEMPKPFHVAVIC
jgi:hypothetical protein